MTYYSLPRDPRRRRGSDLLRPVLSIVVFGMVSSAAFLHAETTSTWLGGTGVWSDASNWNPDTAVPNNGQPLPSDEYHALIDAGSVELDLDVSLRRLTIAGGSLDLRQSAPLDVSTGFAWSGGGMTAGTGAKTLQLGAGADSTWSGVLTLNETLIANAGNLTLADGVAVSVTTSFGVNAGLRNLPGATVTLAGSGTWSGEWFGEGEQPDGFNNQGTLVKSGAGTFVIGGNGGPTMPFQNAGNVQVNVGVLQLDAPVPSATGNWTVAPGAELRFREAQTLAGSSISGAGSVVFDGNAALAGSYGVTGTTTLNSVVNFNAVTPTEFSTLVLTPGGNLRGSSALAVTDTLSWAGFIGGSAVAQTFDLVGGAVGSNTGGGGFGLDQRTFNNFGTFTWTGGATPEDSVFGFFGNAVFSNRAGATFDAAGNGIGGLVGFPSSVAGMFDNAGTLEKSGEGTLTRLNWRVANSGLVDVKSGRIEIAELSQPGGSFQVASGASLSLRRTDPDSNPANDPFTGTYNVSPGGTIEFARGHLQSGATFPTGAGTVALLAGARVSLDTLPADLVRFAGATHLTPPSQTLTLPNAEFATGSRVGLSLGDTLRITGQLDWTGGDFTTPAGFINATGGTLETAAGSTTTLSGIGSIASATGLFHGNFAMNAGGLLTVGAIPGTTVPARAAFSGDFNLNSGSTLRINTRGTVENNTHLQVADGAVVEMNPSTTGPGDARLAGGTVTTSGTGKIRVGPGSITVGSQSYSTLDNVAVNGTIELAVDRGIVRLINGADVTGDVNFAATGASSLTAFEVSQPGELDHIAFRDATADASSRAVFVVTGGHTVKLGADTLLEGLQSLLGDFFASGAILDTGHSTIVNEGVIRIEGNGRQMNLAALDTFENRGTLEARGGASLVADRGFTQTAGRIRLDDGTFTMSNPFYRSSDRTLALNGGSLEGRGTFRGLVNMSGGVIAPGTSVGLLTIGNLNGLAGSLSASGGALSFELGGFNRGVTYDALDISGPLQLSGAGPELKVALISGFDRPIAPQDTFTLVLAADLAGSFANVANGGRITTTDGLGSFAVNYGLGSAFDANAVVLSDFTPVPEPAAYGLVFLVLALVVARRINRSRDGALLSRPTPTPSFSGSGNGGTT